MDCGPSAADLLTCSRCDPPRQVFSDSSSCNDQDSALAICSILTEEEGCFQECHLFIDPEPFFEVSFSKILRSEIFFFNDAFAKTYKIKLLFC